MILKMMKFTNPHLLELSEKGDSLHHFNITNKDKNFSEFSDVKFVCMGGKPSRMLLCAVTFHRAYYGTEALPNVEPENLTGSMDRYVLYKVGPVLFVSHGVGISSVGIVLHEMIKLVQYAGCSDVAFIRVGTSGGIGVDPGTVVVTDRAVNTKGKESHIFSFLGKDVARPTTISKRMVKDIVDTAGCSEYVTVGATMTADDFYEGQVRMDGAICSCTKEEQTDYIRKLHSIGVKNIEMEATLFGALLNQVNIPGAVVCVTLVDRMVQNTCAADSVTVKEWEERPVNLIVKYMTGQLSPALVPTEK